MKGGKKMSQNNSVKITAIIAGTVILLALVIIGFLIGLMPVSGNTISAQGYSSMSVTPDKVTVYFNIETNGSTAKEAKDANNEILERLNIALILIGIPKSEIQTQGFNIYENNVWERDRLINKGYKASHQIKIVLNTSESSLIASVIDAGVDSGALLGYINFELSPKLQSEYKSQALKLAGEDAKLQASAMAEGVEKKLGKLVSVSTSDFYYQPWNIYSARGEMVATDMDVSEAKLAVANIVPGSQEVNARVTVVYKIK
jgi:uncharacterized protein YggE